MSESAEIPEKQGVPPASSHEVSEQKEGGAGYEKSFGLFKGLVESTEDPTEKAFLLSPKVYKLIMGLSPAASFDPTETKVLFEKIASNGAEKDFFVITTEPDEGDTSGENSFMFVNAHKTEEVLRQHADRFSLSVPDEPMNTSQVASALLNITDMKFLHGVLAGIAEDEIPNTTMPAPFFDVRLDDETILGLSSSGIDIQKIPTYLQDNITLGELESGAHSKEILEIDRQLGVHEYINRVKQDLPPLEEMAQKRHDLHEQEITELFKNRPDGKTPKEEYEKWIRAIGNRKDIITDMLHSNDSDTKQKAFQWIVLIRGRDHGLAHKIANTLIEENLDVLEQQFIDRPESNFAVALLARTAVGEYTTPHLQGRITNVLSTHQDIIRERLADENLVNMYASLTAALFANNINVFTNDRNAIEDIVRETPGRKGGNILIAGLLAANGSEERQAGERLLTQRLSTYGLDASTYIEAWRKSREDHIDYIKNIETIDKLESAAPGSTAELTKMFNIHNFGRYPVELLIRQYERRFDNDKPHGVVLTPQTDWNGAFFGNMGVYQDLHQGIGNDYDIRIVEAGTKYDIARKLIQFKKDYRKISFALIAGHGTKDSIEFGGKDATQLLRTEDFLATDNVGGRLRRVNEFFEDNPIIILNSCSTGQNDGIAMELSSQLSARVTAPNKPTAIYSLKANTDNGNLNIDVTYFDSSETTYVAGQPS